MSNVMPVVILQHPDEVGHPKGSVNLLSLSLAQCLVHVGEIMQPDATGLTDPSNLVLLYPDAGLAAQYASAQQPSGLLVLDGTWRQTQRMLRCNPWMTALPRLSLRPNVMSAYRVRKARRPHQLSTLEATCLALGQMEGDAARYAAVLRGFDGFVSDIARRMPQRTACTEPEPATSILTLPGLPE